MAKKVLKEILINHRWCKSCRICIEFCPTKVLEMGDDDLVHVVRPEACTVCMLCELRCPDLAIEVVAQEA